MKLLVVKCGSAIPEVTSRAGDFEHWIAEGMGIGPAELRVCFAPEQAPPSPDPGEAVVVTGSAAMVSRREPWSERTGAWLGDVVREGRSPVLGICFGHQLLAQALGGRVGPNPSGRQIGTTRVDLARAAGDPLLGGLPASIDAQVTHVESVLALPAGARLLAASEGDPHHAFALGDRTWGVQFHPEFDAGVIRGYIEGRRAEIEAEGLDASRLLEQVREAPEASSVLARFARLARSLGARAEGVKGDAH